MLKRILLADSGTGHTEEMLEYLLDLPSLQRATLSLLHVVPPQASAQGMTEKWEDGAKVLAGALQRLKLDPQRVTTILRQGEPKDTVLQVADELDADLIVMGSRGLKRLESILENSVSQYVFQLTSRPMLLVKDDIYVKKLKRLMVAVDKSKAASYCLELALFLVREISGGQLFLTYVDKALDPSEGVQTHVRGDAAPELKAAIARAKQFGIEPSCLVTGGQAGPTICQLAGDKNVDLLILGSPDRRPTVAKSLPDLDRLLGGSLSDYVRVHANCPVLLGRTSV
ncbi:universal stress protein UspA [Rubidibacter lacunae KORDI 51-2]|uniref:Universal stress protein UspA n=1 Tax=Rubidibacter lacunae KORDI 51-2 TaxID=582515 RepID=U5DR99_9CHRO|nr:universal stress protein [Rubidibacter lacunae]ERN43129.1 universal stress protein UspA [Rubidibacter lacunae KORDI 51-2]